MRRLIAAGLSAFLLLTIPVEAGLASKKTMYVGGTLTAIKEHAEGVCSTNDEKTFVFDYKEGKLNVPYSRIMTSNTAKRQAGG